jgi:hypothetical protein
MSLQGADQRHGAGRVVLFGVASIVLLVFAWTYVQ